MDNRRDVKVTFEEEPCNPKIDPRYFWMKGRQNQTQQNSATEILATAVVKDISKLENREGVKFQLISHHAENSIVTLRIIDVDHYKQLAEEENIISMELSTPVFPADTTPRCSFF